MQVTIHEDISQVKPPKQNYLRTDIIGQGRKKGFSQNVLNWYFDIPSNAYSAVYL